jgi:MFS family permease
VSSPGAGLPPLRRNRDFVLLQAGQLLSTAGTESTAIAYPLLVLATTHSAASAGIATFARLVPYAVFGLLAGVVADRWNRKHVMIASDLVRALAIASLVVALLLDRLTFAQITVVAFVEGTGFVFFNIAETGALRSVVPPAQLPAAAGAEQARLAIVSLAGAPLGGALFGVARGLPFAVDAASYLFSFVSLLAMRKPFQEERELDTSRLRSQIAEGFRWLWAQPFLRTCALIFALGNFALAGLLLAVLVIGKRQGLSSGEVGVLIATFGVCTLAGSLVSGPLRKLLSMRAILVGEVWTWTGCAAFLVWPSVYVLMAGLLPQAFLQPTTNSVVIGYRFAMTPDRLIGRVNSVARNIALLAYPLGPLAAGFLLGAVSARATVAVFVVCTFGLAVSGTLSPSIRNSPSLSELDELPAVV